MGGEPFDSSINDRDEKRTTTLVAAESSADQLLKEEMETQAGSAEAGPALAGETLPEVFVEEQKPPIEKVLEEAPTGEVPVAEETASAPEEAVVEPARWPWWKRLFEGLFRREAEEAVEAEVSPVVETVPPLEPAPKMAPEEEAPLGVAASSAPPFALGGVRGLAQEELARERQDRRRTLLEALREVTDDLSAVSVESLLVELEVLDEEERRTLQYDKMPVRERTDLAEYIRERKDRVKQHIAEVEAEVSQRVAETDLVLAELEWRGVVADLRQEVEQQKRDLATIEARAQRAMEEQRSRGAGGQLGLVPTLLALLLVAAVGVAGILLPRQTGPDSRFLVRLATMYQANDETEEAIQALDEAVEAGIDDTETLGHVGEMYRILKEFEKAIKVLERAVDQDPQNEGYRFSLAQSYGSTGQHLEAIAHCEVLIEINPANVWYYAEVGHNYRSLGDYDQALDQYQNALDIDPSLWHAYYFQGDVYRAMEKYDEAVEQYEKALEIDPDYYWTRLVNGQSYAGKSDQASAIEQYQVAIEINPDQAEAYYYLGEAYLTQGHFDLAVKHYRQAIERNDRYAAACVGLGKAYVALDDCPNAIVQFSQALRLDANDAEAQEGLEACEGQ